MNCFRRSSLLLTVGTLICLADTTHSTAGLAFKLIDKSGSSTSYILEMNELAVMQKEKSTSKSELFEKLAEHPSYKLFAVKEKKIQTGNVFYKNGNKDEDHRYISTGEIIVIFDTKQTLNFKDFAAIHQLKYIKTIGASELQTVLFSNHSSKNDIELSSTLTKLPHVKSAKPNWILPLKLF